METCFRLKEAVVTPPPPTYFEVTISPSVHLSLV